MKLAITGQPNTGKTTLFNELTGTYQHVGNWPGVTVEKKEGNLRGRKDVTLVDLPGIYSLSPYTLEEVITREYITNEKPDGIINIVDASNLERNLYFTTQILDMGIPTVIALNMIDILEKSGDTIDVDGLSRRLGVPVVPISAVSAKGIKELSEVAIKTAEDKLMPNFPNIFEGVVEKSISDVSEKYLIGINESKRYYAVKLLEDDEKIIEKMNLTDDVELKEIRKSLEDYYSDEIDSIIIHQRYNFITDMLKLLHKKNISNTQTISESIDRIVTNKFLALPIFFAIFYAIYYISITTVGDATIGMVESVVESISEFARNGLVSMGAGEITVNLIVDGIIGSIGAIFTFVPQLMILFFFLSLLEDCGYMSRIAFIMDKLFRKFGLSGKSFIPMLIGTGCSVPGIMATRTIENKKDRDMTILLTPFMPCGAKLPVFGMMIAMVFKGQAWVGPSLYLIAIVGIILTGLVLKRTKRFGGDSEPFVMELPSYKIPTLRSTARSMWDKAAEFIIRAGTIIFASVLIIWFLQSFNFSFNYVGDEIDRSMLASIGNAIKWIFVPMGFGDTWAPAVATVTGMVAKEVVVATFASVGQVTPIEFTQVSAFAFMIFIVFSAPCVAAIGAMKAEYGNIKDTVKAVLFQTGLAYALATLVNQIGKIIFAGTEAMRVITLDYTGMEEASEAVDISGGGMIVLVILGAIFVVGLIIYFMDRLKRDSEKLVANKSR